jgi:hypothetical protein
MTTSDLKTKNAEKTIDDLVDFLQENRSNIRAFIFGCVATEGKAVTRGGKAVGDGATFAVNARENEDGKVDNGYMRTPETVGLCHDLLRDLDKAR